MANFNFLEFLSSISKVAQNLNSPKKQEMNKPTAKNQQEKTAPSSPKQKKDVGVIVEMLRNHDKKAKEIDEKNSKKQD